MKMLMITCDTECVPKVHELFAKHGVRGFTEVPGVRGYGTTGAHLGTRAYPGAVTMIVAGVADHAAAALVEDMRECRKKLEPGEGFRVFAVAAEELV